MVPSLAGLCVELGRFLRRYGTDGDGDAYYGSRQAIDGYTAALRHAIAFAGLSVSSSRAANAVTG